MHVCCCVPVQAHHTSWLSDPLEQVDGEAVEKEVQTAYKVLYKMSKVCAHQLRVLHASYFVLTAAVSAWGLSVTGIHCAPVLSPRMCKIYRSLPPATWDRWQRTLRV